jgi:hypothetical protein
MKKGMNRYLAGIMLCLIVVAVIVMIYASSKNEFSNAFGGIINKIKTLFGV